MTIKLHFRFNFTQLCVCIGTNAIWPKQTIAQNKNPTHLLQYFYRMTTRERREEYSSSNVVRVLHPSRPLSPNNVSTDFDNNLGESHMHKSLDIVFSVLCWYLSLLCCTLHVASSILLLRIYVPGEVSCLFVSSVFYFKHLQRTHTSQWVHFLSAV